MSRRIIVDSSVVIKWVVPEAGTDRALALRLKHDLYAPELIIPEIANIFWKKCQRCELSREEVGLATGLLENSGINYISMGNMLTQAANLAVTLAHPAYDCVYLVAALEMGCSFVTADARLIQKLR